MNRLTKAIIASTAVAAMALIPISQSFAGGRHHGWRGHHSHKYERYNHRHHHFRGKRPVVVYRDRSGDAFAAGVMGLALGAIIAGAATAPSASYAGTHSGYYPAPPPGYGGAAEPWSPAWYSYCTQRFRSFDPQSGTYLGYDGNRHFCVAR